MLIFMPCYQPRDLRRPACRYAVILFIAYLPTLENLHVHRSSQTDWYAQSYLSGVRSDSQRVPYGVLSSLLPMGCRVPQMAPP